MLHIFYGNDVIKVRKRAHELLSTHEENGANIGHISVETFSPGALSDLASASSLFVRTEVTLIDMLSDDASMFEVFLHEAPLLAVSPNIFVVIEGPLDVVTKKALTPHAKEMVEEKRVAENVFNPFLLPDAFLRRDKKSLWILLAEAWQRGLSSEEIIGTLYWQIKMLRLAERTKNAEEAGQKPFVYDKAKRALGKFKSGELDALSRGLLCVYHDGHTGKRDIDLALERWVLEL